jgi:hypothetical protein
MLGWRVECLPRVRGILLFPGRNPRREEEAKPPDPFKRDAAHQRPHFMEIAFMQGIRNATPIDRVQGTLS